MKKSLLFLLATTLVLSGCVKGGDSSGSSTSDSSTSSSSSSEETKYTITFNDDSGEPLYIDRCVENNIPYYGGVTPTKAQDNVYTYEFNGWDKELVPAVEDTTYKATFTATYRDYVVKFVNYDGSLISEATYHWDDPITVPDASREDDDTYSYVFTGWDKEVSLFCNGSVTYTALYNKVDKIEDLGVKTIAEAKALCEELTGGNEAGIVIDYTRKLTIKGLALSKFSLLKTTKKYGYDISSPYKLMFGDASGYIAIASNNTGDGNSLYGKVGDYAGKETSKYEVTAYLSKYMGVPELYINGKTFSFNSSLDVSCDVTKFGDDKTLTEINEIALTTPYNCSGYGYSDIYNVKSLLCVDHKDKVYEFTDGEKFIKVLAGNTSLSVGLTYDIRGYISFERWIPAIYALSAKVSTNTVDLPEESAAVETTCADLKKLKASQDETNYKMDNYIKATQNLYKATVYISAYDTSGSLYMTMGDSFDPSDTYPTKERALNTLNEIQIINEGYANVSEDEIELFNELWYEFNEEITIDLYFTLYYQEYVDKKPCWKVFILEDYIPELIEE